MISPRAKNPSRRKSRSPRPNVAEAARQVVAESLEQRVLLSAALMSDAWNYPLGNFTNAGLSLNGGAAISNTTYANQLELTDSGAGESRSAFANQTTSVSSFFSTFNFQVNGSGASGLAIVFQGDSPTDVGGGADGSASIPTSVALSFLTTPTSSQTLLTVNGVSGTVSTLDSAGVHFDSGDMIDVTLEYDGSTLNVTETDATTLASTSQQYLGLNIASVTGANAYVGFTGADLATGNTQSILNWEFANGQPTQTDLGGVSAPGTYTYQVGGNYFVNGAGTGIGTTSDQLSLVSQSITGDSTLAAQVIVPSNGSSVSEGLMLRDTTSVNSAFAWVGITSGGVQFISRSATGGQTVSSTITSESAGANEYLELVSDGPDVSGYVSTDGNTWTLVGTAAVAPIANNSLAGALMGLTVSSGSPANTSQAQFSSVSLTPNAPIGVDTGAAGRDYYEQEQLWVNIIKESTGFGGVVSGTTVPLDDTGYPTTDFSVPIIMDEFPDSAGVYTLSMNVNQNPTIVIHGGTLSNQVYNADTQMVTASVTVPTSGILGMTVTNTSGGARAIQLLRPGYSPTNAPVFTTNYLNYLQSLHPKILRFMNFTATNDNPVQTWAQRTLPSDPIQTGSLPLLNYDGSENSMGSQPAGTAWEYAIMLANDLHADMWINIPAEANDNYVQQLALLIKNGDTIQGVKYPALNPDLNVYIEYSNETWNSGFAAYDYTLAAAAAEVTADAQAGTPSTLNYQNLSLAQNSNGSYENAGTWQANWVARRILQISNDFASVFGQAAINTRIRPILSNLPVPSVIAGQLAYLNAEFGSPNDYIYAIATATYANMNGPANSNNTLNGGNNNPNMTAADVLENLSVNSNALTTLYDSMDSLADTYGLQMAAYESGPDLSGQEGTGTDGAKVQAELSPQFSTWLEQYYQAWFAHGGGPAIYFTAGVRSWGQQYGDFQLTDSNLDLDNAKEIGLRTAISAGRAPVVPSIPTGLTVTGVFSNEVNLAWNAATGLPLEYRIDASTNSSFTADLITQVAPSGTTAWTFTGLLPGVTYYFRIRSSSAAGDSNNSAAAQATTSGTLATPAAPTDLLAADVSNSSVQLNWIDNAWSETGFVIDEATDPNFTQNVKSFTAVADATQLIINDLNGGTTYYFRVRAVNAAGGSAEAVVTQPLTTPLAAPVALYTFSEGGGLTVDDSSGDGSPANGTISGGVTRVAGPNGTSALSFDGSTGSVSIPASAKLNIAGEITVSAWINTTSVASQSDIIAQSFDGINTPFYLALDNADTVEFGTVRTGTSSVSAVGTTAAPLTDGQWHFIAGVFDGSEFKVYVDGVLVGSAPDSYGVTIGNEPTTIGSGMNTSGGPTEYFPGSIADVSIFNAALSDSDIATLAGDPTANVPQAKPYTYSGVENSALTVATAQGVLSNDVDPNGLTMNASLLTSPASGSLTLNSNGSFTYTPTQNFVGTAAFTYQANDLNGSSVPQTVTITVLPAAPVGLQPASVTSNQVVLTWSANPTDLTGFIVQQSTDSIDWTTIATPGPAAQTATATGLNTGTPYFFRVAATSSVGNSAFTGTSAIFVNQPLPPIIETTSHSGVTTTGNWWTGTFLPGYYDGSFLNDGNQNKGGSSVTFNFNLSTAGNYDVAIWYPASSGNASNVPVDIHAASGTTTELVNEQQNGGQWVDLGIFAFNAGAAPIVIRNTGTNGLVVANAVELTPTTAALTPPPPGAFAAVAASTSTINLSWSENSTLATGFLIQQSPDGINWTTIATPGASATTQPVSGLNPGTNYYFRIQATGGNGNSTFSTVGPVTTPSPLTLIETTGQSTVTTTGHWWSGTFIAGYYGNNFLNDGNQNKGGSAVSFNFNLATAGSYDVSIWYPASSGNAANVPVNIPTAGGTTTEFVNEQQNGGQWVDLGVFAFNAGAAPIVFSNSGTSGLVVANAVKLTADPVVISPLPAQTLAIDAPATTPVGATMPPITVSIENSNGKVESGDNSAVTLSIASGPAGGAFTATSTITVNAVNGVATFNNIALNTAGNYVLQASDVTDDLSGFTSTGFTINSTVAGRFVFYNNSIWDGNNPAANASDLNAIAPDKTALLPGGTATYANITDYSKGINGIIVDLDGLPSNATLSSADFQLATGDSNNTSSWTPLATGPTVTLLPASGGITPVDLTWPDGTIVNTWLKVTVLADANTGLAANDVFYFGNLVGDVFDSGSPQQVTAQDLILIQSNIVGSASITNPYDLNKDGSVDAQDLVLAQKNAFSAIQLITPV
jgi:hypothetical protein